MSGRPPFDDAELIERLGALAGEIAWPATPDLAGRVTAAIEAGPARTAGAGGLLGRLGRLIGGDTGALGGRRVERRSLARRSLVLAVIALLAIAVAAAAIGLGVPGIRIDLRPVATPTAAPTLNGPGPSSSTAAATPNPTARPTPPAQELGPLVSLDQARAGAGFSVLLPTATGYADPAEVHLIGVRPFTRVTLSYPDGTLLTQFLGEIQPDAFQKIVGGGTTVEPVRIGDSDGYWITGAQHELMLNYLDPDGQTRWQEVTVTGNVLIWQAGTLTFRLETPLDRAGAIALATSLR